VERPWFSLAALALIAAGVALGCGGESLTLVGTVERKSLELAAPVSEKIVEIAVQVGQPVAAGEVLVRLDSEVADLELVAAEARFAAAQAGEAAAEREYARIQGLRRANVSTAQQLDNSRQARDEAVARRAEQEARVAQNRHLSADLTVRAGEAGIVDQLPYEVGERVPAGGVVAVVLAASDPWVRVWVPARAAARLTPGTAAKVEVEGIAGKLNGRVEDVAREPEFTPHFALTERERANLVYEAKIRLVDAPPELRPGVGATVRLELARAVKP
jgi:HlyD family secretion protein